MPLLDQLAPSSPTSRSGGNEKRRLWPRGTHSPSALRSLLAPGTSRFLSMGVSGKSAPHRVSCSKSGREHAGAGSRCVSRVGSCIGERINWQPQVIRYADDFVVAHHDLEAIKEVQSIATQWLRELGLELKPSKTRITHTLHSYEGNVGFDFLGWTVRQHVVGKTHSGKSNGQLLGFKTIITPSKEAQANHQQALREKIQQEKTATQGQLIHDLNKIITGWTNYHSAVASKKVFSRMRQQMYSKLRR
jgi:hypothetical protein